MGKYATYWASLAMKSCEYYMPNSFPHAIYSNLIIKTSIPSRGFSNNAHINFVSDKIHHRYSYFSCIQFPKENSTWNSNFLISDFFSFFLHALASLEVIVVIHLSIDRSFWSSRSGQYIAYTYVLSVYVSICQVSI